MDMAGWVPPAFPLLGSSPSLQQRPGYSSACLEHLWFIEPETAGSCRPGKCLQGQSAVSCSCDTWSWQSRGPTTPQPEQHKSRLGRGASSLAEPQRRRENHPYQATWHEEDAAFSALVCASKQSRRTWNGFRNELGVSQGSGKCALQ